MPRYLWQVSYTTTGVEGLLSEGGTSRRDAITSMVESVGGHVEACYFAFGTTDLYVIGEVPDEVAAASLSLRTAVTGAARSQTVVLLTPEQLDEATRRDVAYRPPGEG
ncbi:MAG: GYD domain-containing protein [Chloroflexota bacterium]|nr:GYD domain-containing protein [Chloroflexota bacterium]